MKDKIAVIGGGAWGTALANLASEGNRPVEIYLREDEAINAINSTNENKLFLKGVKLNPSLKARHMDEFESCEAQNIIWTVPTQFSRMTAKKLKDSLNGKNILNASKGIEIETGKLVVDTLKDEVDAKFSIISGPSFAIEVAQKLPTAVSLGSYDIEDAKWWQKELSTDYFRAYTATDVIGLEIGGSLKNVVAIAAGISDGIGFKFNTRAALITRGLAEIIRLGMAYGAKKETFLGLSGIGDLVLTTTADNSRNRQMGLALAKGETYEQVASRVNTVAEGVPTAKAAYIASQKLGIEMPITTEIYKVIFEGKNAKQSVKDLLQRPANKQEVE